MTHSMNWTNASEGDLQRLKACSIVLKNFPNLLSFMFHKTKPELSYPPLRLMKEIGCFSGGEQVLIRLAMDIWGDEGKLNVMQLMRLDRRNYANAVEGLTFWNECCG